MTPILFLDIDGVPFSGRAWLRPAAMGDHAVAAHVVRSGVRDWISQHFPNRAIAAEAGEENR